MERRGNPFSPGFLSPFWTGSRTQAVSRAQASSVVLVAFASLCVITVTDSRGRAHPIHAVEPSPVAIVALAVPI